MDKDLTSRPNNNRALAVNPDRVDLLLEAVEFMLVNAEYNHGKRQILRDLHSDLMMIDRGFSACRSGELK